MTIQRADITIVGLGPGDPALRTGAVQTALDGAERIFLRAHPGVDVVDLLSRGNVTDIEGLRQPDGEPGGRWHAATLAICDAAEHGPVALAIPGHPRFGEGLVVGTLKEASQRGLTTQVMDGISVVDIVATALGFDPVLQGAQLFTARSVAEIAGHQPFAGGMFPGSPLRPMLFTHVYDATLTEGVARALHRILPPDHPVIRVEAAGMPDEKISQHTVGKMSGISGGPLVALWVPAQGPLEAVRDPRTQQHITALLRAPGGCPWDREQTHTSLRDDIIEEAYEVVDAIDANDSANLAEELGDLFLLICMHAQIAEENGEFTLEDVYAGIATKIIRRHPHVFGDVIATKASDLEAIWAGVKAQEQAENPNPPAKAEDGQPRSMPALTRARNVLRKHPLEHAPAAPTPEERSRALLDAVAAIVAAGNDPERVLRDALAAHINNKKTNH